MVCDFKFVTEWAEDLEACILLATIVFPKRSLVELVVHEKCEIQNWNYTHSYGSVEISLYSLKAFCLLINWLGHLIRGLMWSIADDVIGKWYQGTERVGKSYKGICYLFVWVIGAEVSVNRGLANARQFVVIYRRRFV